MLTEKEELVSEHRRVQKMVKEKRRRMGRRMKLSPQGSESKIS